ncbi:MAG: hypothetical protein ABI599_12000 [Flavobacteriales bacterium]
MESHEIPSPYDLDWASDLFGVPVEDITTDVLSEKRSVVHMKYHPDRYMRHNDPELDALLTEVYREMMDRLRRIEEHILRGSTTLSGSTHLSVGPLNAENLQVELVTNDKDLKYRLFGAHMRWLERGDRFFIPRTRATLISSGGHKNNAIGFNESIKLFLTYGHDDALQEIVIWFYTRIAGQVTALWIDGQRVAVEPKAMFNAMARRKVLEG